MTTVFAAAKKQQVKQETKKLEEQSRKMQQEIKDLDEKMIKSNDAYEACQEKLISVQKQLKKTQQELKEAKTSKEDQSRIMSKRIKFLYENGNMAYMEVIFEANNFQEFLKRADYVSKIPFLLELFGGVRSSFYTERNYERSFWNLIKNSLTFNFFNL